MSIPTHIFLKAKTERILRTCKIVNRLDGEDKGRTSAGRLHRDVVGGAVMNSALFCKVVQRKEEPAGAEASLALPAAALRLAAVPGRTGEISLRRIPGSPAALSSGAGKSFPLLERLPFRLMRLMPYFSACFIRDCRYAMSCVILLFRKDMDSFCHAGVTTQLSPMKPRSFYSFVRFVSYSCHKI